MFAVQKIDGGEVFGREFSGIMLEVPHSYLKASQKDRDATFNGTGPGWFPSILRKLLNYILFVNVTPATAIHDWDYTFPKTKDFDHKAVADARFYRNMFSIIEARSVDETMKNRRKRIAFARYMAVKLGGESSFLKGK